jgi:hypothetical protein
MLIFTEGGKPEDLEKNPCGKGENQQTTQPEMKYPSQGSNSSLIVETGLPFT